MRRLINFKDKNIRKLFIYNIIFTFFSGVLYAVFPYVLGFLIDEIISKNNPVMLSSWLVFSISFSIFFHSYIFYFPKYLHYKFDIMLAKHLFKNTMDKLLELSYSKYDQFEYGYLFNVLINDNASVASISMQYIVEGITSIISIIAYIILLLFINTKLTILILCFIPLYILSIFFNRRQLEKLKTQELGNYDRFIMNTKNILSNKKQINVLGKTNYFKNIFNNSVSKWIKFRLNYWFWFHLSSEMPKLVTSLTKVIVLSIGANMVLEGNLSVGIIVMFYQYIDLLLKPFSRLSEILIRKKSNTPSFNRVNQIVNVDDTASKSYESIKILDKKIISLNNLSLLNKEHLLYSIKNLTIEENGLYILKGQNGSGKSMLLNYIFGINNVENLLNYNDKSSIKINKNLTKDSAYLTYPHFFFRGNIKENITFGIEKPHLLKKIVKVLSIPNLEKVIELNPLNLSLGEQQKIALARIFFMNKKIIFLDEPFSNLDVETQYSLSKYISNLKNSKVIFVITHNDNLEQYCDYLINIDSEHQSITVKEKMKL